MEHETCGVDDEILYFQVALVRLQLQRSHRELFLDFQRLDVQDLMTEPLLVECQGWIPTE